MTADQVAVRALEAIRRRRHEVTLTPEGRLLLLVNRLAPRLVDYGFARFTRRVFRDVVIESRDLANRTPGRGQRIAPGLTSAT